MDYDNLHINIKNIIDNFIFNNNIPHIIFHGPNGSGKKHLLSYLINKFYKNEDKKKYTLYINCAHDKGISFIRNELKYFSKSNLYNKKKLLFKSVILFNADKLTIDAQSDLRRSKYEDVRRRGREERRKRKERERSLQSYSIHHQLWIKCLYD